MVDGKTLGIAIKPLGEINSSFCIKTKALNAGAKLHFHIKNKINKDKNSKI